jgi:ElaB/YqjD/DUF883 family membrane-anchored ribosome-binding protein
MTYQDVNQGSDTGDGSAIPISGQARAASGRDAQSESAASDVAQQAGDVAQTAKAAATDVASEAQTQVRAVADELTTQARALIGTTQDHVREQARQRAEHAAQGLRSLAGELQALSQGRPQEAERLAGWVRSSQQRLQQWSDRLDRGGIDGVVQDLTSFARRRPLVFLGACLGAGFVVGRIAKDAAVASADATPAAPLPASSGMTPVREPATPAGAPR